MDLEVSNNWVKKDDSKVTSEEKEEVKVEEK